MPPAPDRTHILVTASLGAVVAGLTVVIAPGVLPALALAVAVFAVLVSLL
ncbi:hypothetical protein GCM10010280_65060 [Streptomyces pilosus]|uniref:Uncharacterized protein n=1 Tax=Streptomyces pilosus TaxID=28893 RepID=A0A918F622_9ACTN|nr:hypothetical protein GCM10010280_65060 [Streptomyces pilosus]